MLQSLWGRFKFEDSANGIPQGSWLGQLYFLLLMDDLLQALNNSSFSMYADDTGLCYWIKIFDNLSGLLNEYLQHLDSWL